MTVGRTDAPCGSYESDALAIAPYARGLADFVCRCETPLTIGIQGEWGSGKTSIMRMVRDELEKKRAESPILIHWFDTWQYGALGDDETLGLQLLTDLTTSISATLTDDADAMRAGARMMGLLRSVASVAKRGARVMASAAAAGLTDKLTGGVIDGGTLFDGMTGDSDATKPQLGALKAAFEQLVGHYVAATKSGRVVVFVDDLDRIRPGRAVALLEVLKNFMEVGECVFVLACDYDVVKEGVRDRLGILDREKVDAFFDKLFQVPFLMPVNSYENGAFLQKYIEGLLSDPKRKGRSRSAKQQDLARSVSKRVNSAVTVAVGTNPRALKRFFNVADLMLCVDDRRAAESDMTAETAHTWEDERYVATFVAVAALNHRWPEVAAYISGLTSSEQFGRALSTLVDQEEAEEVVDEEFESLLQATYGAEESDESWRSSDQLQRLGRFMKALVTILDQQPDGRIDEQEFVVLSTWLARLRLASTRAEATFRTGFYRFRDQVLAIAPTSGDAFLGLIRTVDAKCGRNPKRFSIARTEQRYWVQIRSESGPPVSPLSFYVQTPKGSASPKLVMRLNFGGRGGSGWSLPALREIGEGFIERTRSLGVGWARHGEGYRLEFDDNTNRPPPHAMDELRGEIMRLYDLCLAAVVAQEREASPEYLTPDPQQIRVATVAPPVADGSDA